MKEFRAELWFRGEIVDYMEYEEKSKKSAVKYADERFNNAYPYIKGDVIVIELKK
jgi:hypothetical protein